MKTSKSFLAGLIGLAALSGCQQDPYSSNLKPGQQIVVNDPDNQQQDRVFSIESPDLVECVEASECTAEIVGHVPAPGKATLTFKGLPQGAVYDSATNVLTYTPGYEVVDVGAHPDESMILIPVTATVRSTTDVVTESSRVINILVKNKLQAVQINVVGNANIDEGNVLEQTVEVTSADFPFGPFTFAAAGAPAGTEIIPSKSTPNRFQVRFVADYTYAGVNDESTYNGYVKRKKVTYQVGMPLGAPVTKDETWVVKDIRQTPTIIAPESTVQGLEVTFDIKAEDLNNETAPKIIVNTKVPFGRLTTTTIVQSDADIGVYPSRTVRVKWDQLWPNHYGTTTPIDYEVCVQRHRGSFTHCFQKKVMVTLKQGLHAAPSIDLTAVKALGTLKAGKSVSVAAPVLDVVNLENPVKVEVISQPAGSARWENGMLYLDPQSVGQISFSVHATNMAGTAASESLNLEVLPTEGSVQ